MTDADIDALVARITRLPGPTRLVAVDGPGGSGKTTFADRLASAAGGAPIVRTDDFASADNPVDWWPRLLDQVIAPLARGEQSCYQRYDWSTKMLAEWHRVEPAPIVILEGVTAGRSEWAEHLSFVIWIDAPRDVRLRRAVARDGPDALDDWELWMAAEDRHYQRDPTRERADLIVDGTTGPPESSRPAEPRVPAPSSWGVEQRGETEGVDEDQADNHKRCSEPDRLGSTRRQKAVFRSLTIHEVGCPNVLSATAASPRPGTKGWSPRSQRSPRRSRGP